MKKRVKLGLVGLGRLGFKHAENIVNKIPNAVLTSVCTRTEDKLLKIRNQLDIEYIYTDFDEMLYSNDLDAVVISSSSEVHCSQIEKALSAGLHVFSEKPLGINEKEVRHIEKVVNIYPEKFFMLGFMRRFDKSYARAKNL